MLDFHDQRFLAQPNAAYNESGCKQQIASKAVLRLLSDRYVNGDCNHGPFFLRLTDLHASNILVDRDWNSKSLIDLEWLCSVPADMFEAPYWLAGAGVDEINGTNYEPFDRIRREFMATWTENEKKRKRPHPFVMSDITEKSWKSNAIWFWHALSSINAMYRLVPQNLCTSHFDSDARNVLSNLWSTEKADVIVQRKLKDKAEYDERLKKLFDVYDADDAHLGARAKLKKSRIKTTQRTMK